MVVERGGGCGPPNEVGREELLSCVLVLFPACWAHLGGDKVTEWRGEPYHVPIKPRCSRRWWRHADLLWSTHSRRSGGAWSTSVPLICGFICCLSFPCIFCIAPVFFFFFFWWIHCLPLREEVYLPKNELCSLLFWWIQGWPSLLVDVRHPGFKLSCITYLWPPLLKNLLPRVFGRGRHAMSYKIDVKGSEICGSL